jgi:hypothetical protein
MFSTINGTTLSNLVITQFTDKAWFQLSGYMNPQNTCLWALEDSHTVPEEPLHLKKEICDMPFPRPELSSLYCLTAV